MNEKQPKRHKLPLLTEEKKKELKVAYQLTDMGAYWQISNMDFFADTFFKKWRRVRHGENVPFLNRLRPLQDDVVHRISQINSQGQYQPKGTCFDQSRTNFLYLATAQLEDENPMRGKTVLQVKSTSADHSFNIVTKLTPDEIKELQKDEDEEGLFHIAMSKIKKNDPSAYIIDSWRIGYFNEPKEFLHYSPAKDGKRGITKHPTRVKIQAIGIVGDPNQNITYYRYGGTQAGYVTESIDEDKLNHAAWKKFRENVNARVIPEGVFEKMLTEDHVITYNQIANSDVSFFEGHASSFFGGLISGFSGAAVAMGISLLLGVVFSIPTFGLSLIVGAAVAGGIGFTVGLAIGIGVGTKYDSDWIKNINLDKYLEENKPKILQGVVEEEDKSNEENRLITDF